MKNNNHALDVDDNDDLGYTQPKVKVGDQSLLSFWGWHTIYLTNFPSQPACPK
ncbi:hypothetical protein Patl1_28242 [Pistacia atlantica]|uniref:Uncharacterized protein n=1 Tax=Pistacia atlantica TaxID=434234 RepID=A0ACC1BC49_9ROSI|nr:hypothetical protein Patl1_28242 [Pistacia atlantica]